MAAPRVKLPIVKVKVLNGQTTVPVKSDGSSDGSIGIDLCITNEMRVYPTTATESAYLVHFGIAVGIPEGYHGKLILHPAAGSQTKLRLSNGMEIIDSTYKGEITAFIENVGSVPYNLYPGYRMFKLLIEKNEEFIIEETEELD